MLKKIALFAVTVVWTAHFAFAADDFSNLDVKSISDAKDTVIEASLNVDVDQLADKVQKEDAVEACFHRCGWYGGSCHHSCYSPCYSYYNSYSPCYSSCYNTCQSYTYYQPTYHVCYQPVTYTTYQPVTYTTYNTTCYSSCYHASYHSCGCHYGH